MKVSELQYEDLTDAINKRARLKAYKISCYIREGSLPDFEI